MSFAVAELRPGEKGGFAPRGALKRLWQSRDFETVVSGPAETGKTWGCLQYADALLWKYPGAQGVIARKTYASLVGSALRTYTRILGTTTPVKPYGGEKPEWFQYPNGSRLWVAGLDNPGKALSSERDFIYVNQAEELVLEDWETLLTRCTGRGAVMPYTRMFADCNPGPPTHWIRGREREGKLRLLESRHEDNPTLYDDDCRLTPQGVRSMAVLDSLSGVRKERLRYGRWVQAEGAVYDEWDTAVHLIDEVQLAELGFVEPDSLTLNRSVVRDVVASVDWGFTNPGVLQVWPYDGDKRMVMVRETYRTRKTIDWWIEQAREQRDFFGISVFVCDPSEPAYIEQFNQAGLNAIPAYNEITHGINAVMARLRKAGDGRPRLQYLRTAVVDRDEDLSAKRLPTSSAEEKEVYIWPKGKDGKPLKEVPLDVNNHGQDAERYAVAYVDELGGPTEMESDEESYREFWNRTNENS